MKVIVTGALGQVGQEVVALFTKKGIEVVAYSSKDLDITDARAVTHALSAEENVDALINCAAYTAVDRAEEESEYAFLVNATGVENLARTCKNLNILMLHLSTDYVFDGHKQGAYSEKDVPVPQNVYGASKLAGEKVLQAVWEKHIILRVSWVFGRFGRNFVKTIAELAKTRPELKIVADQQGAPTGASHIAEVILKILSHPSLKEHFGLYHYTDAPLTNWYDFANSFVPKSCKLIPIKTSEYPLKAKRPDNSALNCDKIRRVFGVEQTFWQEELNEVLQL